MNKKICRLCLAHPSICYSLVEKNIREMLEALTTIKIPAEEENELNLICCLKCMLNVKLAYNIQQNIIESNKKFEEKILLENVKVESLDTDTSQSLREEVIILKTEFESSSSLSNLAESDIKVYNSKCFICGTNVEASLLNQHVQDHYNTEQNCDVCSTNFDNIEKYRIHMSEDHGEEKMHQYKCTKCGITFRYKSLYNIHLKTVHRSRSISFKRRDTTKKVGPFTCPICSKEFLTHKSFKMHSHERRECPVCKSMITKSNFTKHVANHSSGPQICELCGSVLRSLESLRGHLIHAHNQNTYTCEECGKIFRKKYTYLLHMKKHKGTKDHVCETCGKTFLTLYYMRKHVQTAHLKLRPYICEFCKKAFSSKFALTTHRRQHTNETPYKCEICGDGFRQNVSLRAHRKSKHNIIEEKNIACTICGKMFGCEQAIISHMRLH